MSSFNVLFTHDLDSVNNIDSIVVREYCELIDYSNFNICINTSDDIKIDFNSDIMTTDLCEIESFVNKFGQNEYTELSFNSNSGSKIIYDPSVNTLFFNVYTYKEGTVTNSTTTITLNSEKYDIFYNVFNKLLKFKILFYEIRVLEDDDEYYSSENEM